jgi:S-adenosylmethionine-diacylglycerol 3-amino-3-carboxypropyl transferase
VVRAAAIRQRVRTSTPPRGTREAIRYSCVWEDADVLCEALAPVATGGRLLSIASAGDNVLALLTLDPEEIVAVDRSASQLACLELRCVALGALSDDEFLAFLGVTVSSGRPAVYGRLRGEISAEARAVWDARPDDIARGIIHAGRFERYLRSFRRYVLPLVHPRQTVTALREQRTGEEQARFYTERWENRRWRSLFRLFFSRAVMSRRGRDHACFEHISGDLGALLLERTRRALCMADVHSNPFLAYIVTGTYPPEARPRYLRAEHLTRIRDRLSRVRLVKGTVDEAAAGRLHGLNLSDVFEYMDPAEHERCYHSLTRHALPGARLVYWNMAVHRACPGSASNARPLPKLAAELHTRDRGWFYGALHVDEVTA